MKNTSTAQGHGEGGEREAGVGEERGKERKKSQKLVAVRWRVAKNWAGSTAARQSGAASLSCFGAKKKKKKNLFD